jgi:hypothetical protein
MFNAWRKDACRANWRYRAGGDGILPPEPRAGACRRELRVGTDDYIRKRMTNDEWQMIKARCVPAITA